MGGPWTMLSKEIHEGDYFGLGFWFLIMLWRLRL